jgi:enoyl-CoA hydratase/carnithine racemase
VSDNIHASQASADQPPLLSEWVGDHIVVLTLNRPNALNSVNAELARALEEMVARVEEDSRARVAIITGAGDRAFCAGADLKQVALGRLAESFTETGGFAGFVNARRNKPWIAAVNGFALAGGLEIALACDMVVASQTARLGLPEVKRGLIASAGGLYRLPRALPKAVALEMIATGEAIDAQRAYQLGLVNILAEQGDVLAAAIALAHRICANAPLAVKESLAIARAAVQFDDPVLRQLGDEVQERLGETEDYVEGATAFVEKRPPLWKGR